MHATVPVSRCSPQSTLEDAVGWSEVPLFRHMLLRIEAVGDDSSRRILPAIVSMTAHSEN